MPDCTELQFASDPNQDYSWYLANYTWLQNASPNLPNVVDLLNFYIDDMNNRNLTPLDEYESCYEYLFSYFLANYPIAGTSAQFKGQTFLQMSAANLPGAISKTFGQIGTVVGEAANSLTSNLLGVPLWVLLIIVAIVAIFIFKKAI
jgi:hypothetical protein